MPRDVQTVQVGDKAADVSPSLSTCLLHARSPLLSIHPLITDTHVHFRSEALEECIAAGRLFTHAHTERSVFLLDQMDKETGQTWGGGGGVHALLVAVS